MREHPQERLKGGLSTNPWQRFLLGTLKLVLFQSCLKRCQSVVVRHTRIPTMTTQQQRLLMRRNQCDFVCLQHPPIQFSAPTASPIPSPAFVSLPLSNPKSALFLRRRAPDNRALNTVMISKTSCANSSSKLVLLATVNNDNLNTLQLAQGKNQLRTETQQTILVRQHLALHSATQKSTPTTPATLSCDR